MAKSQVIIDDKEVQIMVAKGKMFFVNSKALLLSMALYAKTKILERTALGKDFEGRAFEIYTPTYKMFRQKHGRPTARVDLFFSGRMLGAMDAKADPLKAVLYFKSRKEAQKASGLNYGNRKIPKRREFFALSRKDKAAIAHMAAEAFDVGVL